MKNNVNPMLLADFYKISHRKLYDRSEGIIYATWTPRKSRISGINSIVVFGLQGFIQKYLIDYFNDNFFNRPLDEVVNEYKRIIKYTLNEKNPETKHIEDLHKLGYLPIKIDALEEGTICPIKCPCVTIQNTKPEFLWITNFIETLFSMEVWKPMTSATIAYEYRKIMDKWAEKTCDNNLHVDFQGHDFSMRGMSCLDSAMTSGAGHLTSFKGTDTIPAICYLENYYGADVEKEIVGTSIPATEHSIMEFNSYGTENDEYEAFKRIITEVHPKGFVSIVSDTWNLWHVLGDTVPRLKEEILNRDGRVVIRPDSGDPCDIICGLNTKTYFDDYNNKSKLVELKKDCDYADSINKGVIELLWDIFGGTINEKGYKVLDSHIGCIYGDAITLERADEICARLESKGFASSNIVFGIGSYCVTKDTLILCSDLKWRKAEDLEIGQEIICFDENPIYGNGAMSSRKYKIGKITANSIAVKNCIKISCGNKELKCSKDHPVLVWASMSNRDDFYTKLTAKQLKQYNVQLPRGNGLIWKRAKDLVVGDKIAYMCDTWNEPYNNFDLGWLSGLYDGEGTLCRWKDNFKLFSCCKISISQNEGEVLNKIRKLLRDYGFTYYENATESGCIRNTLTGGVLAYLRFLGLVRPLRLLNVAKDFIKNLPVLKRNTTYQLLEITNLEDIKLQEVASITTSEGTFITNGFLTHNTYNMNSRDTFGFALKSTYAVKDGKEIFLFKDPITDSGEKKSQKGMVVVFKNQETKEITYKDGLYYAEKQGYSDAKVELLKPLFKNGKLLRTTTLKEIRRRINE